MTSELSAAENLHNSTSGNSTPSLHQIRKQMAPFLVPGSAVFVPVNAYFIPALVCCTLAVNLLVCLVLLKPHMRSTTNTILTAMAVADTLTGLCPLPCYLYFYTAGNYREWVSYDWCYGYFCLMDFLPSIFHTTSVWLTLVLAIQRYLSVCHAQSSRRLCTIRNATIAAGSVFLAAALSQIGRFVEMDYFPLSLRSRLAGGRSESESSRSSESELSAFLKPPNLETTARWPIIETITQHSNDTDRTGYDNYNFHDDHSGYGHEDRVTGCTFAMKKALVPVQHLYFNAHYLFRIFFIHFIPCMSLIVINGLLMKTMREGQTRRTRLLKMNRLSESRRLAEVNRTTLMLVIVVALFLVVEVPSAVIFFVHVLQNSFGLGSLINYANAENVTSVVNLVILLSYPMNFFIYCAMSTQFRTGFVNLFRRRATRSSPSLDKNGRWPNARQAKSRKRSCYEKSDVPTRDYSAADADVKNLVKNAGEPANSADAQIATLVISANTTV